MDQNRMKYAPAISTILSPEYLAGFAIDHYGLDKGSTCQILKTGINHTYLITTPDKKFVLRVYYLNWRKKSEIEEELSLLDYLRESGISVSYPIKSINDRYIHQIDAWEGERWAVLFSFAEGESVRIPSERVCFHLGVTMANMHRLTLNRRVERTDYDAHTLVGWAYQRAKHHFPEPSDEMRYFSRANAAISAEFGRANTARLRYGVVHLDLWYENMRVAGDDKITVFDFDNCGNGWLFLDIAYSMMILFKNEPDQEIFEKKKARFYEGYESIVSISAEEKRLLPYGGLAIWLYYTGIHVQRFNDFSNQFLSKEFMKYWMGTVNRWMEFNRITI